MNLFIRHNFADHCCRRGALCTRRTSEHSDHYGQKETFHLKSFSCSAHFRYCFREVKNSCSVIAELGSSSISRSRRRASFTQSSSSSTNGDGKDAMSFSASFARLVSESLRACSIVSASVTVCINKSSDSA